ncbi:MAG: protein translocase subunit SecF [Chloroflexota bacterium]
MNILGKRYVFFVISLLIIIPGLALAVYPGLQLSIDFTGGSLLEVKLASGELPPSEEVTSIYEEFVAGNVQVQTTSSGSLQIRSAELQGDLHKQIEARMAEKFNSEVIELRFETVGGTVGAEVTRSAVIAVAVAALLVVFYIAWAFKGLSHAFRYGMCAILAMLHDIAIVISLGSLGGILFGWQVDALFLTALLTVIGFSIQDKVVVFDRIRENSGIYRRLPFEALVNHSVVQTLQRSINTQLMTVEFMLLSLALFGGVTLREFAIILLVGLFSGTYSSIFIASSALVVWENREWKNWFGRGKQQQAAESI